MLRTPVLGRANRPATGYLLARIAAGRNAVAAVVRSARSSNVKIKQEMGWLPRFPTAREGVADAVARLAAA